MLHVDHIRIDPAYRAALAACRLTQVQNILSRVEGRVAAWSRTTDTTFVAGPPGQPGFYVKRYFYPTWRKRLRTTFRGTFFGTHRGRAEYRALSNMRALGIAAVRPVAYGSRRIGHFVTACFLITEEVPDACNMTTFAGDVRAGRRLLPPERRGAMVRRLAEQVARMHAAGFSHGQLFWRNILARQCPDGAPEFFFLDAQPRSWRQFGSNSNWWQRELAHLTVSALPFTTATERLRFLLHYFDAARLTPSLKAHAREIAGMSRKWQRHETQRIKMNDLFEQWNRQLEQETSLASRSAAGPARPPVVEPGT